MENIKHILLNEKSKLKMTWLIQSNFFKKRLYIHTCTHNTELENEDNGCI